MISFLRRKKRFDYLQQVGKSYNVARRTEPPRRDYPGRLVEGSFHFSKANIKANKRHKREILRSFSSSLFSSSM